MYSVGLELTFIPDLPGAKEFADKKRAQKVADKLLKRLSPLVPQLLEHHIDLHVKVDPFRSVNDEYTAWIIEVTNGSYPTRSFSWCSKKFVSLIQRIFTEARKLRLYPRIRRRGVHHPSGGCHLHCGISDLFNNDEFFLPRLARFEKNLYTDLANRPYIRWLFSEWFDVETNSIATFNEDHYRDYNMRELAKRAYEFGRMSSSIAARYSYRFKPAYPTYEFRFFDSVDSAKEIARNVRFLEAWVAHHVSKAMNGVDVKFTLSHEQFKALKNEDHAWLVISTFLRELGLNPDDFRKPFEENYVLRMRHGEMS